MHVAVAKKRLWPCYWPRVLSLSLEQWKGELRKQFNIVARAKRCF